MRILSVSGGEGIVFYWMNEKMHVEILSLDERRCRPIDKDNI